MTAKKKGLRVGIAGAGSIAFGSAALLHEQGHIPVLWSPSGSGTQAFHKGGELGATGAVETCFSPQIASSAKGLVQGADILMIAVPAYGHKRVMDAIAPHIKPRQQILISSHAPFGALYLSRLLEARGVKALILAWGTTVVTGRKSGANTVNVNTVRKRVDIATLPHDRAGEGLETCVGLFGDRFVGLDGLMAVTLSNLNPQNHMGIALCNMTRMEHGEDWSQSLNVTPGVGRLLEALDKERLAIAGALDLSVRDIFEHFSKSFHVGCDTVSNMNKEMAEQGCGGLGPATPDTRYVLEDVPYGLVPTAFLGQLVKREAPLHESGIEIFSAIYGVDFRMENQLMKTLDIASMSLDQLEEVSRHGMCAGEFADGGKYQTA